MTCPAGHYCESSSASPSVFPVPCPQGTYRSSTGATASTDCVDCSQGRVCPYLGNAFGDEISLPCLPGHPCPAGTATFYQHECPAGKYSDLQIGLVSTSDTSGNQCVDCPAGFACSAGTNTLTNPMVKCTAGHYCPAATSDPEANDCPAGTYSDREDLSAASQCYDCPIGKYC